MSEFASIRNWWRTRAPRERGMLLAMCAALAAFAWWYALLLPLRGWRAQAQARYDHAAVEWLAARDGAIAIRDLSAGRPRDPSALAARVLATAEDAGIAVSRQRHDAQGLFEVELDAVQAPALLGWLDSLQRLHAIGAERVLVEKRDGRLHVQLAFRTAAAVRP